MTINKFQGQSVSDNLCLDLSYPCFSADKFTLLFLEQHIKNLIIYSPEYDGKTIKVVYDEVFFPLTRFALKKKYLMIILVCDFNIAGENN